MTWKKILLIAGIFVSFIALPLILLSNPMMDFYQNRIDKNPNTGFSKWLQLAMADACYRTMRPERSAAYYYQFLLRYKDDERRPRIMLRYAFSLEDANRNAEAIEVYQQISAEYPDTEVARDAQSGINRIRYMKPK